MTNIHIRLGIAFTATILTLGGCAFDPSTIPVPGATVSGPTYGIRIAFTNALNLPAGAKVMANGARVGNVRSVTVVDPSTAQPGHIVAEVDIDASVRLPTSTIAQLRQNTMLGDIFVGLTTPPDGFDTLMSSGDTIPLTQTRPALQIEDLMSGAATFLSGGALHTVQDIIDRTNAVLPEDPNETTRIFGTLTQDVRDVAGSLGAVDGFLDAVEADIAAVLDNRAALSGMLTDEGAKLLTADAESLIDTTDITGRLGVIAHAIAWLTPLVRGGDATAKAFVPLLFTDQPFDLDAASNLNRVGALLRDRIIPFLQQGPKANISRIGVEGVANPDETARIAATLRMIGMVR